MSRLAKWSLPAVAFAVVVALSAVRVHAQDDGAAAAKGKVTGVIHNADGTPAANVTVRLVTAQKGAGKKGKKAEEQAQVDGEKPGKKDRPRPEAVATGTTDESGKFELEAPAGKYTLMASLRGQGRVQKTFQLKAGETVELEPLTLKKPEPKKEAAPTT